MRKASSREVRDWGCENGYSLARRGRFSARLINHFNIVHRPVDVFYQHDSMSSDSLALRRVRDLEGEMVDMCREVAETRRMVGQLLRALGEEAT